MIGRTLAPVKLEVTAPGLTAHARAAGNTAPAGDLAAPLSFLVAAAFGPARRQLAADLPVQLFLHLVGGEFDLRAGETPIRAGDVLTTAARVADIRGRANGDLWVVDTASTNQNGEMVGEARFSFLVPGGGTAKANTTDTLPPLMTRERPTMPAIFDFVRVRPVEADDAVAAGEHFRGETAAIGHAAATIVESLAGGDPTRLRRLSARVLGTLMFGRALVVHGKRQPKNPGLLSFESMDEQGAQILADGVAEIIE